jgi:predicted metal-binding protein
VVEDSQIISFAISQGISRAAIIGADKIVVQDEVVDRWCAGCPEYGRNLNCPPALPPPSHFRQVLAGYRRGLLVQLSGTLREDPAAAGYQEAYRHASKLHQIMLQLEDCCRKQGFARARCFIGGCCRRCGTCPGPGNDCLRPAEARSSMEGNGINVVETCAAVGWEIEFPVRDSVSWTGLVLLE